MQLDTFITDNNNNIYIHILNNKLYLTNKNYSINDTKIELKLCFISLKVIQEKMQLTQVREG